MTTTIVCHAYDSIYVDPTESQGEADGLHLWCLDRESIPIHIVIKQTPIYFYIELPSTAACQKWSDKEMDLLYEDLKRVHGKCSPIYIDYMERQKLYYYRGEKKTSMAALFFRSRRDMNICASRLLKQQDYPNLGRVNFRVFEKDISIRRKVFTMRKTRYAQWFSFSGIEIGKDHPERMAKAGSLGRPIREFILEDYKSIVPISPEKSMGWTTNPRVFSFDIETYTDNHHSLPDKTNPDHVVYMISCLFQITGEKESRDKYIITTEKCHPIEGAKIIFAENEEELITFFLQLIDELDPEIIMGYNIFGYDYPYLDARHEMYQASWEPCSRLLGYLPNMYINSWSSSGYGKNIISYLQMPGRISIDLLPLIRRDYKFDKYTLDFVSQSLLGAGKHDVSPIEMFEAFESKDIEKMTSVTKYCIQDADLVLDLYEKMNVWVGLVEMSSIVGVEIMELFTRGQQIRCVSQIYDLTARSKIVLDDRSDDGSSLNFEGGFVGDPIKGLHDNVICLDFASLYPSIMRAYNICYTTLIPPIYYDDFTEDECHTINIDDKVSYRFVKEHIFKGILPRLVEDLVNERKNVRKEIDLLEKKLENELTMDERRQIELTLTVLDKRQLGLKVSANSMYGFLGVQEGGKLPLLEGAISITAKGRQLITDVNNFLSEKYQATIVYNDTDSSMVTIPAIKNAQECHYWGNRLADEISGTPERKLSDGTITPAVPGLFPPPLKMEFEKAVRFLGIAKKKYAAFLIDKDGSFVRDRDGEEKILKRGIVIARRDNFPYLRKKYTEVLRSILRKKPIEYTFNIIVNAVLEILSGKLPPEGNLTIIRGLGQEYKSKSYFMKIFQDELSRMGHPVQAGDRLEYVVVEADKDVPLGRKLRLIEMYKDSLGFKEENRPEDVYPIEKIDYLYYLTNGLQNPLDQLFSIGYIELFQKTTLGQDGFSPANSNARPVYLSTPIKMMTTMIKDNMKGGYSLVECKAFLSEKIIEWFKEKLDDMQECGDICPLLENNDSDSDSVSLSD